MIRTFEYVLILHCSIRDFPGNLQRAPAEYRMSFCYKEVPTRCVDDVNSDQDTLVRLFVTGESRADDGESGIGVDISITSCYSIIAR